MGFTGDLFQSKPDPRDLRNGDTVSDLNGYYDSQNLVCVGQGPRIFSVILHRTDNREGGPGLALYHTISKDEGKSWSPLKPIEQPYDRQSHDGYQLVHKLNNGKERIFIFYGYNEGSKTYSKDKDRESQIIELARTDMQLKEGYYFRYTDDLGESWSNRIVIPVRRTTIDTKNPWQGEIIGMFLCDKPVVIEGGVYMAFQKTKDGAGETPGSEVFFLHSPDLLQAANPESAHWQTLPEGEKGLQAPSSRLALGEEPHILSIQKNRVGAIWRTETGKIACSYSNDLGQSWDKPDWLKVKPSGDRFLKNPRGAITPHLFKDSEQTGSHEFALLTYNNGHTEREGYTCRRVMWITCGRVLSDGFIYWGEPEIFLYWSGVMLDDREDWSEDWAIVDGAGYADFWEEPNGQIYVVESNKLAVRFHKVNLSLIQSLRTQPESIGFPKDKPAADFDEFATPKRGPVLRDLRASCGFTIILCFTGSPHLLKNKQPWLSALTEASAVLDHEPSRDTIKKGFQINALAKDSVEILITDGFDTNFKLVAFAEHFNVSEAKIHCLGFTFDGGSKVASAIINEKLCDGGHKYPKGWDFFPASLGEIGGASIQASEAFSSAAKRYIYYDRMLLNSETIAIMRQLKKEYEAE